MTSTRTLLARISVGAVAVGLLAGTAGTASAASPAQPTSSTCYTVYDRTLWISAIRLDADEQEVLRLINSFRAQHGRPALKTDHKLMTAAAWASNDSALRGFAPETHVDTLGRNVPTRVQNCGYTGYGYTSEINYYGSGTDMTPAAAVRWWTEVSKKGHREAVLDPRVTAVGIGVAEKDGRKFYTVNMGDRFIPIKLRAPRR